MTQQERSKPAYHHGDLRESLLERAAEMIENDGIENLSLRALARDLKVSHSAPARHFKSKKDLLQALAQMGYAQITQVTLSAANHAGADPLHRLNAMGKAYVRWCLENRALYHASQHPDVSKQADDTLRQSLAAFIATIHNAVQQAQITGWQKDVPTETAMHYVVILANGIAFNLTNTLYISVLGQQGLAMADRLIDLAVPVSPLA